GWREGDEQADRAWYACSPASELSGINGLGNGHPATDLINNAVFMSGAYPAEGESSVRGWLNRNQV
ncbi:hypothetical protein ACEUDM_21190, partial [Aeromonas caviae]|uniref:hypothetical protein n=1 Tax=Aeromonas caviae TaxID=648 RepID=UPI0038D01A8D